MRRGGFSRKKSKLPPNGRNAPNVGQIVNPPQMGAYWAAGFGQGKQRQMRSSKVLAGRRCRRRCRSAICTKGPSCRGELVKCTTPAWRTIHSKLAHRRLATTANRAFEPDKSIHRKALRISGRLSGCSSTTKKLSGRARKASQARGQLRNRFQYFRIFGSARSIAGAQMPVRSHRIS